jgi:predicted GNAT family N-acyltransferase
VEKTTDMMISLIEFGTPEFDEALELRYIVLRKPLGLQYSPEQLEGEWSNLHIAAFNSMGSIVGYLNLTPYSDKEIKMRQVAVLPELQGKGIGAALVAYSEEVAKAREYHLLSLHARKTAVDFYLKLGYEIVGNEFEEVTLPHFKMQKAISS